MGVQFQNANGNSLTGFSTNVLPCILQSEFHGSLPFG